MLSLGIMVSAVAWTGGSLADPDVWWHVRTGDLILRSHAIPHSDPWSFTAPRNSWVPTAWISDVLFALVHRGLGTEGLRALRILLALLVVCALWLLARRTAATTRGALIATGLTTLALTPFLRERPQVLSLLFVVGLAWGVQRILAGLTPRVLPWVFTCWVWAQVHGMWVLLPVAILGAGVLAWIEDRERVPLAARCTTVALLSWLVVLITPVGPRLAWWPLVVRRAAAPITEWQPTVPTSLIGIPFVIVVVTIVVRWARSEQRVSQARLLYMLSLVLFGFLAYRNLAPAAILLLPELARCCDARPEDEQPIPVAPLSGVAALVAGITLAGVHAATSPTVSSDQPVRLVRQLAAEHRQIRLLNHYDVGGLVTGIASPPLHVAIDGRTDIWSKAFVRSYINGLGGGDWRPLVNSLRPDAALLRRDSEVARGLVLERHWRVVGTEGSWELLEPPL